MAVIESSVEEYQAKLAQSLYEAFADPKPPLPEDEQDEPFPTGRLETHGKWILNVDEGREWKQVEMRPFKAKIGNYEVTVLRDRELLGSEGLHVYNLEGDLPNLGTLIERKSGRFETQMLLTRDLDAPLRRLPIDNPVSVIVI